MLHFIQSLSKKSLLMGSVILLSSFGFAKYFFDKNTIILDMVFTGLNNAHYSPLKMNDEFSEKAYDLYIKRLDYSKKFLLQSDVDILAQYRKDLDNQILAQNHIMYNKSVELINKRIKEKEAWYKAFLAQPMDYKVDEEYETDGEKLAFMKTEAELKREWEKMIKYQVLSRMDDMLEKQEKAKEKKDTLFKFRSLDSIEVDARKKTLKANEDWFKRLYKFSNKDRFAQYVNAIAKVYDPHTEYMPAKDKKRFDQSMSGQFEGIGARLQATETGLKVSEIIVGSPSFKQGELKAGDEIQKVAQGSAEPIDITGMEMEDAIELIKGRKGTEVRLTVKKSDNSTKVIPIVRDVIEMEETYAKSAILNNNNTKMGYIYLPSFYTDFTRSGAHHCAKDMRKEIEKLKAQNIKGLIIDLRDNGGGSLQEVVEMAGLFFDKGPVVQVKAKNNYINVMEDRNPDVAYDGPLAIMVNHGSASASEILAAAIQDYKRGIVIGTPTFGKGTVQSFIDLDQMVIPQLDTIKPIGAIKVTQQKFYRINGGATQLRGVVPDVLLPDPYEFIDLGEKEMENPMPWDEISKANYNEFKGIDYIGLQKNSSARIKKSASFTLVAQESKDVKARKDDTKYNLNLEKYRAEQKQLREQSKKYDVLKKEMKGFTAELLSVDRERIASDTTRLGRENRWVKNLSKDIYVNEVSHIINDMK